MEKCRKSENQCITIINTKSMDHGTRNKLFKKLNQYININIFTKWLLVLLCTYTVTIHTLKLTKMLKLMLSKF